MTMEKRNHRVRHTIFSVLTALITVIIMIPFIWLVILSFKSNTQIMNEPFSLPESFGLENYYIAFRVLPLVNMYKNTMIIAAFTEILCLAVTFTAPSQSSIQVSAKVLSPCSTIPEDCTRQ